MKVYLVDRSAVTLMHTAVVRDEKTESYLDRPPNTNRVLLKAPLRVGAKWVSDGWLHEVVSVTDRVETPAGIFVDCLRIRATSPDGAIAYSVPQEGDRDCPNRIHHKRPDYSDESR